MFSIIFYTGTWTSIERFELLLSIVCSFFWSFLVYIVLRIFILDKLSGIDMYRICLRTVIDAVVYISKQALSFWIHVEKTGKIIWVIHLLMKTSPLETKGHYWKIWNIEIKNVTFSPFKFSVIQTLLLEGGVCPRYRFVQWYLLHLNVPTWHMLCYLLIH